MLQGKVALVTGASRGIGRAIALSFAREGAKVIINYNGNQEKALGVKKEIEQHGGNAEIYACNVSDETSVKEMFDFIQKEYGTIDILVNNAGITKDGLILKMSEEEFQSVMDINLKGTFFCAKYASKQMMKQRSGRIINMSSVVGVVGNAGQVNYSASKAGIIGFTKSLAKELGSRQVTVNAIAPGYIDTDMTKQLPEAIKERILETIPMKRIGKPEDIAEACVFLASKKADYITGQVLGINGGMA
ncbi:3-oxoacyl-[acyl-carrier-protein] reductase [Velocimicrobium porci]|uniref:3-oxoacyl-[acyl-carrier-protein] reductase n=1 Tax=Velocimicrobium porci TaxID=2606634 RepID=A0A6L5XVR8_9FIRM|nr:3-oxoacyl-[acyl-carrier-protein] reductase [Velocimicrobium porci]MSS62926.1 3-oxoacyl-[acyl-carrier-protein] reductase [Velocimicrobium porci]